MVDTSIHEDDSKKRIVNGVLEDEADDDSPLNVARAIRVHGGEVDVTGMIVAVSTPYKMIINSSWSCKECGIITMEHNPPIFSYKNEAKCPQCGSKTSFVGADYVNAKSVQIQDRDAKDEW